MSIVNFSIPKTLEQRVITIMKEKGFSSKAEFFRFAAIYFIDIANKPTVTEDDRFDVLTTTLRKQLHNKYSHKQLPSVTEQLATI